MRATLSTAAILTLAVAATAQERQTAEASWEEGKVTIDYDAPNWRAEFAEAMTKQATWRLGKNDPTRVTLTCGLKTDDGFIPAGDYGMAMTKNDSGEWDLVVYSGTGQFAEGQPGWTIKPMKAKSDATSAAVLKIELSDEKQLAVHFGPYASVYAFQPVAMHPAAKAEFAGSATTVEVMAVPVEGAVKGLGIGTASVSRGAGKVSWNMALTIDGDTATLAFENARAGAIADEKKQIEAQIENVKGRREGADDAMKARIDGFLKDQEKALKKLDAEATATQSYQAKHTVSGKVSKRDQAASTLTFDSERVEGGIILTFGAGEQTASFNVKPSEFRVRRRR